MKKTLHSHNLPAPPIRARENVFEPLWIRKEKNVTDVYERLAKHLDNLPASYPATDSGVELRILKRLFTSEEAEAALALTMFPESADEIAKRLGRDEREIEKLYYNMSKRGLILRSGKEQN